MQKKAFSFLEDPFLSDLNFLTRLLFLLVIFKKLFSMGNLKKLLLHLSYYINVLINNFEKLNFPKSSN